MPADSGLNNDEFAKKVFMVRKLATHRLKLFFIIQFVFYNNKLLYIVGFSYCRLKLTYLKTIPIYENVNIMYCIFLFLLLSKLRKNYGIRHPCSITSNLLLIVETKHFSRQIN